jgi:hypothetical protein
VTEIHPTPLLDRLAAALIAGESLDNLDLLRAEAVLEQLALRDPRSLCDAEPSVIRAHPHVLTAYRALLARLGGASAELDLTKGET